MGFGGVFLDGAIFDEVADGVEAIPGDAFFFDPIANDIEHCVACVDVAIVHIGHGEIEDGVVVCGVNCCWVVVGAGAGGGCLNTWAATGGPPNVLVPRAFVVGDTIGPDEPVALWTVGILGSFGEPRVCVGDVVKDEVEDDFDAAFVALFDEFAEVVHGAILRVNAVEIRDFVAVVAGGRMDGHEPEASDAKVGIGGGIAVVEVVEFVDEATDVADAVACEWADVAVFE